MQKKKGKFKKDSKLDWVARFLKLKNLIFLSTNVPGDFLEITEVVVKVLINYVQLITCNVRLDHLQYEINSTYETVACFIIIQLINKVTYDTINS